MILTIRTTHYPATDLGFLLHKHPDRFQTFKLGFGNGHVFYPEASNEACTVAFVLDVDPVGLVRSKRAYSIQQYVNDRPYVASSFLSVGLSNVFGSALNGTCKDRPELVQTAIPLEAHLSIVSSRGGEDILRRVFEPLGYQVETEHHLLDEAVPDWGMGNYFSLTLSQTCRLAELLSHLYVLIPVLDDDKHYWVGDDEVEKLLKKGEGWLQEHPEHKLIVKRYLKRKRGLIRQAMRQLVEQEEESLDQEQRTKQEEEIEKPLGLHPLRLNAVLEELKNNGAKRVVDLGCGEGKLLSKLLKEPYFQEIVGMDVSFTSLERAKSRLKFDRMLERDFNRVSLIHGSLMYSDKRIAGFDGAALVEVIEHLDPPRLAAMERVVFGAAKPGVVVITTPNQEYNELFETLPAGSFRHRDHRFEWTRAEFEDWGNRIGEKFDYNVEYKPIGPLDETRGAPSQMGVFCKKAAEENESV